MNTNAKAKRILCYGDSNTWGWIPASMGMERYSVEKRWPGRLQELLGNDYEIIEEGLGGRTTMFDDPRPDFPERNGLKTLSIILESHLPLDFVILMLGTTDTKELMNLSTEKIAEGVDKLVETIKSYKILKGSSTPQILLVVPPIVREEAGFASKLFRGGSAKGRELVEAYKKIAESRNILFLDPTIEIRVDQEEGVHINAENHQKLAELIYEKIKKA
jgi:lysophospholipase L1-like esterase